MLLIGFLLIALAAVNEAVYRVLFVNLISLSLQKAMIGCIIIHMVALALDFSRSELELFRARLTEKELIESNRALDRLNNIKNRFISDVSHEMKTPLTVMSINAQIIKAKLDAGTPGADNGARLDMISSESRRLGRMVEELLGMGGAQETGEVSDTVNIGDVLTKTARLFQTMSERKNNRLLAEIPEGLPAVTGNADKFTQVFVNILTNANEHTKDGEIRISASVDNDIGDTVAITVSDTGEGIPADILPNIFERYVTDGHGAGLGLPICKEILERFGGDISIGSEPGKGTEVKISFPAIKKEKEEAANG
jgi:signal transduction histidine kinase